MPRKSSDHLNKLPASIGRYFLRRLEMPRPAYKQRIINNLQNLYRAIQPGDVLLVEGRSKISQIIQLLTKSSWSHAAIYVGNNLKDNNNKHVQTLLRQLHETDRQHILIEAEAGSGVTAVPLSKYEVYNIRICRPFGISQEDINYVVQDVVDNLGKHYDHENLIDLALLALPWFINPFNKRTIQACLGGCTEYKVICSGMIAKAFQSVGYPIVPDLLPDADFSDTIANNPYGSRLMMRHYSQIAPRDFDLSPNFEILKYNIIGLGNFNYQLIWEEKLDQFNRT